jgi:hypothetical protein
MCPAMCIDNTAPALSKLTKDANDRILSIALLTKLFLDNL